MCVPLKTPVSSIKMLIFFLLQASIVPECYYRCVMGLFRQHFGETEVEVEKGKKEERAEGGLKNMTMSKFLHLYQTEDIYQVFDITPDMKSLLINFYFCL